MDVNLIYKINESKTISEMLDGETIIINLENGTYYSVNATGSVLWELLTAGYASQTILDQLLTRYDGATEDIKRSLEACLAFLLKEGLIVENGVATAAVTPPIWTNAKEPFTALVIDRYDDMQEMLLADPIHDVDQTGWPKLKEERVA